MTKALYNAWRPQKWEDVVGQQHVIQTLRNAVTSGRVAHAYLFAGPRGTGKTTAARLLAKAVNCLDSDLAVRPCNRCKHCQAVNEGRFLDLIEIDAASNTSVEDVRDLRDKINFSPNQGKYKVYIIDEVHMLSTAAFNALLKTLEEPPEHAIFILATTEIHKIPATVLSRCQRHEFRRVPVDAIVNHLKHIADSEKIKIAPEALTLIARQSAGGMRDAISLLDQMASTSQEITLELTQTVLGTATSQTVIALVDSILAGQSGIGMDAIHVALDSGVDPRLLARQVVEYFRALLLLKMGNDVQVDMAADIRKQAEKHSRALPMEDVLRMIKLFNAAAADLRGGWQPSLPLEMALAEALSLNHEGVSKDVSPNKVEKRSSTISEQPLVKDITDKKNSSIEINTSEQQSDDERESITLAQVMKAWKKVYYEVNQINKLSAAIINSSKPIELKNHTLTIGFEGDVNRKRAELSDNLTLFSGVLKKVFGVELRIKCVVNNAKHAPPPNIKADGMVAAALKRGGKIVDTQE